MSRLDLTSWQRRRLRRQLAEARDARLFRRTLAVLEFDHGRSAADLARMLGVTRQSVYHWVEVYTQESDPAALADEPGRGRPPLVDEDHEHLLEILLYGSPQDFGLAPVNWTVPLLRAALAIATGQEVSESTLRRVLHRLDYVCKRPRHDLDPDPELEKNTADPPANPGLAAAQRRAGRGRNRPAALPAAACRLGHARRTGPGLVERPQRPAGDLWHPEPAHGDAAVRTPRQGTPCGLSGFGGRDAVALSGRACGDVAG